MSISIGIALGDVTGIGPEVSLKALARETGEQDTRYVVVGSRAILTDWCERLGLSLEFRAYHGRSTGGRFFIHEPSTSPLSSNLPAGDPQAAAVALAWLKEGARLCLQGELDALVTAPVNKGAIARAGEPFVGQTEYLSELAGSRRTAMMLLGEDDAGRALRVVLATRHLPLRTVADALSRELVELAIEQADRACRDLGLERARIAVCGLNPHAGEGGLLGDEEEKVIAPAVEVMRARAYDVRGPLAADALFYHALRGDYDVVVAMYHDQGLAPLKLVAFERGVNWTLGLPFIRTSPDHGTAYDLSGQGMANPSSMLAALGLAKQLARHRVASRKS